MLSPEFSFFLELLGATLLVVMIVYAVRLNRRLSTLQEDKAEFERLLVSFTESTTRAETSVARLKVSATDTAQSLQEIVTRAQALRDDLGFMVERADGGSTRSGNSRSTTRTWPTRTFAGSPDQWRESDRRAKRIRG